MASATISFFYTYNAIFDAAISGHAKLVYAYLCKCADASGKSFPAHKSIAAATSVCVTTVKKALIELEREGLVMTQGQTRADGGRRANVYTIVRDASKGFFMTYVRVFSPMMTAKARLVYLYFCRLASGKGLAYPSHKTTAKACGLSVAGVRLAVDELESAGVITREAQYRENGGQRANLYSLVLDGVDKAEKENENNRDNCNDETEAKEEKECKKTDEPFGENEINDTKMDAIYNVPPKLFDSRSNRRRITTGLGKVWHLPLLPDG